MKCSDCRFYEPIAGDEWKGACTIKLPPQLQEPANNFATTTRADGECDLGQPKEEEPQE